MYRKHMASRKEALGRAKPCVVIGIAVSQWEAPLSEKTAMERYKEKGRVVLREAELWAMAFLRWHAALDRLCVIC